MASIFETLGSIFRDEAQVSSHLINLGSLAPLPGGFRSETYSQKLNCEFVLKIADRIELERQKQYIESLPLFFRKLFPDIFVIRDIEESQKAAAVMERLPGINLHQLLFRQDISHEKKCAVVDNILQLLTSLHQHQIGGEVARRNLSLIFDKIRGRATGPNIGNVMDTTEHRLRSMDLAIIEAPVERRWIHGDAQAGNFIIDLNATTPSVRWIDPLGGSGYGVDDYLYDLSRLQHWLDTIAEILEEKESTDSANAIGQYRTIKGDLVSLIHLRVISSSAEFEDPAALVWFHLYSAFHLAGKLSDFLEPWFQQKIELAICHCLSRAMDEGLKLSERRRQHAVYQHQTD